MYKEFYQIYLSKIYRKRDGGFLSDSSVFHYLDAMNYINNFLRKLNYSKNFDIYSINSVSELLKIENYLFNNEDFIRLDKDGHQMYSAGFHRYIEFAFGTNFDKINDEVTILDQPHEIPLEMIIKEKRIPNRDRILIKQVEQIVNYKCEIDYNHKTFYAEKTHKPYVEGHHIIPLRFQCEFKYDLDVYANILILCPNCHRFLHFGEKKEQKKVLNNLYNVRNERLSASGILLNRNEFIDLIEYSKSINSCNKYSI